MKILQVWLGHSKMSTTADIYSHLDANATGEGGMKLGKHLAEDFTFKIVHKSTWHMNTILLFAEKE